MTGSFAVALSPVITVDDGWLLEAYTAASSQWLKPIGRYVDVCQGKPCVSRGFAP